MSELLRLVDSAIDQPLTAARDASRRSHVIGAASADIPFELIAAAGAFAVALPLRAEDASPLADRYLESSFSPASRSIAQQWLAGEFDFLDSVIFPRTNDSLQRLYYYLCELKRRGVAQGPRPLLYDIAKIPRATSARRCDVSTRRLAADLHIDTAQLPAAIASRNRRRALLRRLLAQRRSSDKAPGGALAQRIARAADFCDASQFDAALDAWLPLPASACQGPRILLAGSAPPDDRLHRAVEAAGGCVIDEYGDHAIDRLGEDIIVTDDGLSAIARHYGENPFGPRSFEERAAAMMARVHASHIDAVILWVIEEEESLVWHVPALKQAAAGEEVPLLQLTRKRWNGQDGVFEEIQHFIHRLSSR
jgi:benzoyl-CoA reductase/2-hydroxyglutaryl-CoA dehydratase subunit BcrC/BadD/HgdB